ncbi:MAG TPA: uracil-DNA glycosylase [Candidatus Eisenbacteria bacterium]
MSDDRAELAKLARDVRRQVDREARAGRGTVVDPALAEWMATKPPAAQGPRLMASGRVTNPKAAGLPSMPIRSGGMESLENIITPAAAPTPRAPLPKPPVIGAPSAPAKTSTALATVPLPADDPRDIPAMTEALAVARAEALACVKCGLCEGRTQVVYSGGFPRHPLMFVGEAPGFHEDQQGVPFVGRAGQLLTDIITAMGFDRNDVYIANVLKCRPPENRDPLPHEIEACWPWLEQQIDLVKPRVICTVGKYSAQLLTGAGPKATIGTLRGKVFRFKGIPVVPTYHPAFLLRSPSFKRAAWEDVQLVREIYLAGSDGN